MNYNEQMKTLKDVKFETEAKKVKKDKVVLVPIRMLASDRDALNKYIKAMGGRRSGINQSLVVNHGLDYVYTNEPIK